MPFELTPAEKQQIDAFVSRYPHRRAALIPTLHLVQARTGYITAEVVHAVAAVLGLTAAQVYEVVSFYSMFKKAPVGRRHVQICTNVACMLRGAEDLVEVAKRRCGVDMGETTADGEFTIEEVECLAACGTAPVAQVNEDYHENLTVESFERLLGEEKKNATTEAQRHRDLREKSIRGKTE